MASEVYPPFLDFWNIPNRRHKWCHIEREVLAVLRRFYTLTTTQETKIFNHMFAEQLKLEGYKDGLRRSSIRCQIYDLERLEHPVWLSVHSTPLEDMNDEYDSARHFIKLAADELGIDLRRRMDTGSAVQQQHHLYPGFLKLRSFFDIEAPEHETTPSSEVPGTNFDFTTITTSTLESPTRSSTNVGIPNPEPAARPSPRSSYKPQIVYRFYNADSSGVNTPTYFSAALWASGPSHIPHPCLVDERILASTAKTHLSRYNIKSPFISTFETPLPAVHRMLTKGNNASFAVIDLSMLDQSKIFSARAILKKDPLGEDITHGCGYDGRSDWLIWGDIPESCIICTIPEEKFRHITSMNEDISCLLQVEDIQSFKVNRWGLKQRLSSSPTEIEYASGEVVGKFLRLAGLPEEYGDVVAGRICQAWKFCWTNELGYKRYLMGVHAAYDQGTSITPHVDDDSDDDSDDGSDDEINAEPDNDDDATRSYEGCIESCDDIEQDNGGYDDTYNQTQDYYYDDGQDGFLARLGEELRQTAAEAEADSELDDVEDDDDDDDGDERTHTPSHMPRPLEPGHILGHDEDGNWEMVHIMDNGAAVRIFEVDRSRVNQAMGW